MIFIYINNKLLTNLLFGLNKYHFDNLVFKLFELSGRKDTFFLFNTNYYVLLIYTYFYNYNTSNYNITQKINILYLTISNYFFKSYVFYLHVVYSFSKLIDFLNINKRKNYLKNKNMYKPTSYFLGFKMSFKGRFTRKQRASSV
jgi:hypothetical protein